MVIGFPADYRKSPVKLLKKKKLWLTPFPPFVCSVCFVVKSLSFFTTNDTKYTNKSSSRKRSGG
jgi:hypothetical protein